MLFLSCTKFSVPKYGGWETVLLFYIQIKLIEGEMYKWKIELLAKLLRKFKKM